MIYNTLISIMGSSTEAHPRERVFPFKPDVNGSDPRSEAPFHVAHVDLDRVIKGDRLCA